MLKKDIIIATISIQSQTRMTRPNYLKIQQNPIDDILADQTSQFG